MRLLRTLGTAPNKLKVLKKQALADVYSRFRPVYLVNEYPKSGGTWLKRMLAEALDLPAWSPETPVSGSCVMQAHWLRPHGGCRTVVLFRDGRDVMVSYYYHSFFKNEFNNGRYVEYMRNRFQFSDYEDTRKNLLQFIKVQIETPVSPRFSWVEFVRYWLDHPDSVATRYDALRRDTPGELSRIVEALTGTALRAEKAGAIAEAHSLERMRRRGGLQAASDGHGDGTHKSFYRSGAVGGWGEHFTDEALEWFEARAGRELVRLGYTLGRGGRAPQPDAG